MLEYVSLAVAVILGAAGHLLAKVGVTRVATVRAALFSPLIWCAVSLYGLSFAFWLVFLRSRPVSAAVPCASLTYALVAIAGWAILGDRLAAGQYVGLGLVLVGVTLLLR